MSDARRAQEVLDALYAGVEGYQISHAARRALRSEDRSLVYGEILPGPFADLLRRVGVAPGEELWDIGSGTGKPVFLAALMFPFSRCVGVEVLAPLALTAEKLLSRYVREHLPALPEEIQRREIRFITGRFEDVDFSSADVVFSHCTTYSPELLRALGERVAALKPGSRLITVGQPLQHPGLEQAFIAETMMEWGESTCYVYRTVER